MFNATSRRKSNSTEKQLLKLAQNMRQQEQKKLDSLQRQAKLELSRFKASCSKTGGGKSDPPPEGKYS